jgi:putative glycosyltransferase
LREFYTRCCVAAEKITPEFEIIFVNDGSPDHSLELAIELYENDTRVRVIDLSRNFGHHKAMMTGLKHARGRLIFLTDCDLEVDPEILAVFYNKFRNSKVDVVYGVQETRRDRLLDRLGSHMFYALFNLLSTNPIPVNLVTTRLMSHKYVKALIAHQEREMIIAGLWAITGFKQESIVLNKSHKGNSTYDLRRKIAHLVNAITSFSSKPLVFIFYMGSIISLVAGLGVIYLIIRRLFFGILLTGWPSLIVSVWFLGGLTIFCVGVIGIYLSKVFVETKRRPYTIIREIYERVENALHAPGHRQR